MKRGVYFKSFWFSNIGMLTTTPFINGANRLKLINYSRPCLFDVPLSGFWGFGV